MVATKATRKITRLPVPRPEPGGPLFAFRLACSVPWAMTAPMLAHMLDIAAQPRSKAEIEAIERQRGAPLENTRIVTVRDGVATIPIDGPIVRHAGVLGSLSGMTGTDELAADLTVALASQQVQSIILAINSPGGEVDGTHEFAAMIFAARGEKPIEAYVSGEACSAAYWIASAADRIVCDPTALVGNIGVIAGVPNPNYGKDANGEKKSIQFVSSQSPNKRPDPNTAEGVDLIQEMLDDLGAEFAGDVASYRGWADADETVERGQGGKVFVGRKAVEAGLADALGSYEGLHADLVERSGRERTGVVSLLRRPAARSLGKLVAIGGGLSIAAGDLPVIAEGDYDVARETNIVETPATPVAAAPPQADADTTALRAQVEQLTAERGELLDRVNALSADLDAAKLEERRAIALMEVKGMNNGGVPWRGDEAKNVKRYLRMETMFAGDPEGFNEEIERERAAGNALIESGVLGEIGSDAPSGNRSATEQLDAIATTIQREERAQFKTIEEARVEAMKRNPTLRAALDQEHRTRRGR